jgi:hypothetical protein
MAAHGTRDLSCRFLRRFFRARGAPGDINSPKAKFVPGPDAQQECNSTPHAHTMD